MRSVRTRLGFRRIGFVHRLRLDQGQTVGVAADSALSLSSAAYEDRFEWPEPQADVIPDARLYELIRDAREAAHEAGGEARRGEIAAGQARRRLAARDLIGRSARAQTIDAGTVMTAVPYDGEGGPMLGSVRYPSGASMTGAFGPNVGVFTTHPDSAVAEFRGWVYVAASAHPQPSTGVFAFRNGERFVGDVNAINNAQGVYHARDNERRFVGEIDFTGASWRPVAGVLEDRRGRLLAVVLRRD